MSDDECENVALCLSQYIYHTYNKENDIVLQY